MFYAPNITLCDYCVFIYSRPPRANRQIDGMLLQTLRNTAQYEPHLRPNFPLHPEIVNVTLQLVTIENLDLSQSVNILEPIHT